MSYAVRNTLILLVVLALFVGGGWSYLYFMQSTKISSLQTTLDTKSKELRQKQDVANKYDTVSKQYKNASDYFNNYDKALYLKNNEDRVFDFLNRINTGGSYTDFSFSFNDSTASGQYGLMKMDISGDGYYRNLINFIHLIEYSKPLNKIKSVTINPLNALEDYGKVNYNFALESYYERGKLLEKPSFGIANISSVSIYNPFYPLIREIPPNDNNLTDVEKSNILALGSNKVFLIDQNGVMKNLTVGDQVYLGSLKRVNLQQRTATFELNKGGIFELVTLEVNNDN